MPQKRYKDWTVRPGSYYIYGHRNMDRYREGVIDAVMYWMRLWRHARAHALMARGKEYVRSSKKGKRSQRRAMAHQGEVWIKEAQQIFDQYGRY